MAQGNLKLKSKAKGRVTKKQSNLRAAAPLILKPKKATAKQAFKLKQSVGSSIGTEKLIASRVGHLELIKVRMSNEDAEVQFEIPDDEALPYDIEKANSETNVSDSRDQDSPETHVSGIPELASLDPDLAADDLKAQRKNRRKLY
ncbi:hypothetical protein EJF18_30105 [Clavispora lusitaniae]|uniref:Uncharacterized protein n=1 Tax=Clavispora lusitaniae TaxID=36911 RepID=A0ACD0WI62_CLALS|nr:hypothetical protein EJF14_30105 [Clavispora lusitaniae]QFZ33545.1 hypothetical protein EJF16_30105 [Clavispora lusitaniae]QFZ39216.1 hypothetical protein EJF15_30105 [Clavispora lusitaniae]QFZ44898.1 hypothetical protein EJF18_30105 [Clavispora lusitaniae]QFZ50575.1 hypothetical protein EJF17_30105 [Clavispora lusitaniae]